MSTRSATDHSDGGNPQAGHFAHVAGDGLGLATLLGAHAGIGGGHIDKRNNRATKLLGDFHATQRLAIALGVGHAETAVDFVLG
jgi:hypothetical protein